MPSEADPAAAVPVVPPHGPRRPSCQVGRHVRRGGCRRRTFSGGDPYQSAGIIEVAEQDAAGLPGRREQPRDRHRLGAYPLHGPGADTGLITTPLIVGAGIVGPVQVDVRRRADRPAYGRRTATSGSPGERGVVAEDAQAPAEELPGRGRNLRVGSGERRLGAADLRLEDFAGPEVGEEVLDRVPQASSPAAWSAKLRRMSVPAPLACGRASAPTTARSHACPTPTVRMGGHRPG